MSDDDETPRDITLRDVAKYQSEKIGTLLDYNQKIVMVCRRQAHQWQELAEAFVECAQMAADVAESCAVAARVSVDQVGNILSNEFDLVELHQEEEEEDESDEPE